MDGTGSETSKRQRLDLNHASHRPPPQQQQHQQQHQQQPPIARSHTLPPPNSYPPQPLPPSPYHQSAAHDHRSLPEPTPHGYSPFPSGHNTPIRDLRSFPLDTSYSRRGSASGSTRSPDEYNHYPSARTVTTLAPNDVQPYPPPHPVDHPGQFAAYPNHDGPVNSVGHHGLPMAAYADHIPAVPGPPSDYIQSPTTLVHAQYGPSQHAESSNQANMNRSKKGTRATQACDTCRSRKAKCDEGRPSCGFCLENTLRCNYQTIAPAKAERANQLVMERLTGVEAAILAMNEKGEGRDAAILAMSEKVEEMVAILRDGSAPGVRRSPLAPAAQTSTKVGKAPRKRTSVPDQYTVAGSSSGFSETNDTDASEVDQDDVHDPAVAAVHDSTPVAGPGTVEHTTAAHRLLGWPSVRAAFCKPTTRTLSDDYVMKLEEKKGLLRVYGRGEGQDVGDGGHPSPTVSTASPRSEEASELRSPPPVEELWGSGFADTPPMRDIGGLGLDGKLEVGGYTLDRLLKSYLENIHILHPFLEKNTLTKMVKRFFSDHNAETHLKWAPMHGAKPGTATLEALHESPAHPPKSTKRKHSDTQSQDVGIDVISPTIPFAVRPRFQRAISTAIVLLVMALGKICEWQLPLPGPVSDDGREYPSARTSPFSPVPSNSDTASPLSVKQSPSSSAQTMPHTSAKSTPSAIPLRDSPSKHPGEDAPASLRNVDVIPGLAYYAYATDILGNCHGGNDLSHVQAHLLAALYAGQMARTFESWTWINSASRACLYLVRDTRILEKEPQPRQDLIKFAFWTCLQLESDILAELDLPQSGVQRVNGMDYPKGFVEQANFMSSNSPATKIMLFYSGQIHVRGILNNIQQDLHGPGSAERPRAKLRDELDDMLNIWRKGLPEQLQWQEDDPPALEINDARLRAKFYGAQYIIHRPFLRLTLDNEALARDVKSPGDNSFTPLNDRRSGPMPPPRPHADREVPAEILRSAQICVGAAMRSTTAFDNIISHRRLVVTNIFGTAHAQFGNVLVLATTYKSKSLHQLVPRDKLEHLFDRTIKFLHSLGPISQTLEKDSKILARLRDDVLGRESVSGREGTSFSSNDR